MTGDPGIEAETTRAAMTPDNTGNDARIDELEVRLAHQDQTLLELGDELYRQQRQIAQLESVVQQLVDRLAAAEAGQTADRPAEEIPPHY
jgi:SlyX protein